jgi:hypothetical protein
MNARPAALFAVLAMGIAAPAEASSLLFLDVPGIPGDSIADAAPDQIDLLSNAIVSSLQATGDAAADVPSEKVCVKVSRAQGTIRRQTDTGATVEETAGFDACTTSAF